MKVLLQRVSEARVDVDGKTVGAIGVGLLVLLGVDRGDQPDKAGKLMQRILDYRIFPDEAGKMNRSVADVGGGILLVSQFTLSADTGKGLRPSFSSAASPAEAEVLYSHCLAWLQAHHPSVACGIFAADMEVSLVNDGPVTFLLEG